MATLNVNIYDNDIIISNKEFYDTSYTDIKFKMLDSEGFVEPSESVTYSITYKKTDGTFVSTVLPSTHGDDGYWYFTWADRSAVPNESSIRFHLTTEGTSTYTTAACPLKKYSSGAIQGVKENGEALPITDSTVDVLTPLLDEVQIPVTAWGGGTTATVEAQHVTASSHIMVAPRGDSMQAVVENGVYCSAQGAGTLTFTCESTPESAIIFDAWIKNYTYGD